MTTGVDVLTQSVPIVDQKTGRPTKEFMIKWQQLADTLGTIPATAAQASALLDKLGNAAGGMLYRGITQWLETTTLTWDSVDNRIIINASGAAEPQPATGTAFHVVGAVGVADIMTATSWNATANIHLRRSGGTPALPTALTAGTPLGSFQWKGYNGAAGGMNAANAITGAVVQPVTTENWSLTAQGTDLNLSVVQTGTTTLNKMLSCLGAGQVALLAAMADQSKQVVAPTTGFSYTVPSNATTVILTPAGTLAAGTITMPATPADGHIVAVSSSQVVTSLTVAANAGQSIVGAPTSISPSSPFAFIYDLASTTWYPKTIAGAGGGGGGTPTGTVTIVQQASANAYAGTATATLAATPTVGNVLLFIMGGWPGPYAGAGDYWTLPAGRQLLDVGYVYGGTTSNQRIVASMRPVMAGDGKSWAVTNPIDAVNIVVYELANAGYISAQGDLFYPNHSTTQTNTANLAAPIWNNALAFGVFENDNGDSAGTVSAIFTKDYFNFPAGHGHTLVTMHASVSVASPYAPAVTWSNSSTTQPVARATIVVNPLA